MLFSAKTYVYKFYNDSNERTVGKLFEGIIHKHMFNFFLDNKLFYKYQSGFLLNNSTIY